MTKNDTKKNMLDIIKASDLKEESKLNLETTFSQYIEIINTWEQNAKAIVITDEGQTDLIETAKEGSKYIKKIRIAIDKARKEIGGEYYKQYKTINLIANFLSEKIIPIEEELVEKSNFIINKRKAEKEALNKKRLLLLQPYAEFAVLNFDYSDMSTEDFDKTFKGVVAAFNAHAELTRQQQEADNLNKIKEQRTAKLAQLGMIYNEKIDAMVYGIDNNENPDVHVFVEKVMLKCSDEEFKLVFEEVKDKINAIRIKEKEALTKANEKMKEAEAIIKENKATTSALNQTKAMLEKAGITMPNATKIPDKIVINDLDKIKLLIETLKNIKYPELTENIKYLNTTLDNITTLVNKIVVYAEERINKIKN